MRRKVSSWLVLALTIAGLARISACGGGSGNVQVTAVAITPTSVSVPINTHNDVHRGGDSLEFHVTIRRQPRLRGM